MEVNMKNGQLTRDTIDSLQAFWPALQVLTGDIEEAIDMYKKLHSISKNVRFLPESYNPRANQILTPNYPLRPECNYLLLFFY